jgi:uncharacterized protein
MALNSSRRRFLSAALTLPAAPLLAAPAGNPSYRTLGKTGLKVTTVGYGCMITSDPSVIARAVDLGINYFDTSRDYQNGNNERLVGAALGARRKNIILSTKVDAVTKRGALEELETSLRELRTDYVDIWYLHGKDSPDALKDELFEAQEIARKQGKIRFKGVSTHRPAAIAETVLKNARTDVVLSVYNFTSAPANGQALAQFHAANIGLVAMKVMAGGTRGRKPRAEMQRPGAASAALKWVIKNPAIATTIPSSTDMEQLEENVRVMSDKFSDADQKILTARLEEIRPLYCRMCGQCDGQCPQGLPVSDVLRYLMYAEGYGQFALGRDRFLALPAGVRSVRCGDCSECAIKCPNGVKVAERLALAQQMLA